MLDGDQRAQLRTSGYRIELFLAALGEFIKFINDALALLGECADILVAIGGIGRAAAHEWDQGRDGKRGFTQGANAPMWNHDASLSVTFRCIVSIFCQGHLLSETRFVALGQVPNRG